MKNQAAKVAVFDALLARAQFQNRMMLVSAAGFSVCCIVLSFMGA